MFPFDGRFPDCAAAERLVLHVQEKGLPLPPGKYGFFEWYCNDADCDCRRALLRVISPQRPGQILATINFGWESEAFYTQWMHGDAEAGREIASASLDPLNPQSELADAALDAFRDHLRRDSSYPQQLQRHYAMFKCNQPAGPAQPLIMSNMSPDEIIRQLQHVPEKCDFAPYEAALRAAVLQQEALTPELIAGLERVTADPAHWLNRGEDCLHVFAIYLLAQFRERRAQDAFLRFFSLPGEQALDLTGDMVTENGAAVLVSVCGGDPGPLLRLIHDEAVNEFVRGHAIGGLLVQSIWGERPREAVIENLRGLFSTLPKPGNDHVWAELVNAVNDFNALELLPEVRRAFAEGLVDEGFIGLDDIDHLEMRDPRGYPRPSKERLFRLFCERNAPVDAVAECSGWLCFRDEAGEPDDWVTPGELADAMQKIRDYQPPAPFIAPPKVGRNDPCPCGSGKKFKKCCGK